MTDDDQKIIDKAQDFMKSALFQNMTKPNPEFLRTIFEGMIPSHSTYVSPPDMQWQAYTMIVERFIEAYTSLLRVWFTAPINAWKTQLEYWNWRK